MIPLAATPLGISPATDAVGARVIAASLIAQALVAAISARGHACFAASGGRSAADLWRRLVVHPVAWSKVTLVQVDERAVPDDHPDRNLGPLRDAFQRTGATVVPMPIDGSDYLPRLVQAAGDPPVIDVVQLGMGADGHTGSLFPEGPWPAGDFGSGGVHDGQARFTLGASCLSRARLRVFLITGADKRAALERALRGDGDSPAGRVIAQSALACTRVCVDRAARPGALPTVQEPGAG